MKNLSEKLTLVQAAKTTNLEGSRRHVQTEEESTRNLTQQLQLAADDDARKQSLSQQLPNATDDESRKHVVRQHLRVLGPIVESPGTWGPIGQVKSLV